MLHLDLQIEGGGKGLGLLEAALSMDLDAHMVRPRLRFKVTTSNLLDSLEPPPPTRELSVTLTRTPPTPPRYTAPSSLP